MRNIRTKLYTENGEYIGTLEEIIEEYNGMVIKMLEDEFEKQRAKHYAVDENQHCPFIITRYSDGCKKCIREKYCNYEEVIDMVTKNVTKRAAKAMYLLSKANEDLTPLMHILNGEENLKQLFYSLKLIDEAQQELVKILAQDNKLEIEG